MASQVLRVDKRDSLGGPLAKHIAGEGKPKSAKPREGLTPVHTQVFEATWAYLRDCRKAAPKRREPKPLRAVEFISGVRPGMRVRTPGRKRRQANGQWRRLLWKNERRPHCWTYRLGIHQDEGACHIHDLSAAVDSRGDVGWNYVLGEVYCGGAYRKTRRALRVAMSAMQDDCHESVGRHFGPERGAVGGPRGESINRLIRTRRRRSARPRIARPRRRRKRRGSGSSWTSRRRRWASRPRGRRSTWLFGARGSRGAGWWRRRADVDRRTRAADEGDN